MLSNAVAAGEGMLQDVALCIPLVTAAVPLGVGVAAGAATEAAATRLSEHVVPGQIVQFQTFIWIYLKSDICINNMYLSFVLCWFLLLYFL